MSVQDEHWMQGAVKHPGAFTKKAKDAGMSDHAFAMHVMSHKDKYDAETVRQANLCLVFERASHKLHHGPQRKAPSLHHVKMFLGSASKDEGDHEYR